MRQVSNILMVALMVVALFAGNCLSCPQVLMALASQQPAHNCCHHRTTPTTDCHSQALSHFVKAQEGNVTPAFAALGAAPAMATVVAPLRPIVATWRAADVAPPDLLALHSLLRV